MSLDLSLNFNFNLHFEGFMNVIHRVVSHGLCKCHVFAKRQLSYRTYSSADLYHIKRQVPRVPKKNRKEIIINFWRKKKIKPH